MMRTVMTLLALAVLAGGAAAQEVERLPLGSTVLELVESEDMGKALHHSGEVLAEDYYLSLEEQVIVSGVALRVGAISAGGNVCSGERFVVWQQGKGVKLSRTEDPCSNPEPVIAGGILRLAEPPRPGTPGQVWRFDPAKGLVAEPPVPFAPDTKLGWGDLAKLPHPFHPMEVLKIGPVYRQLQDALSPADFESLTSTLSELGSGEMRPQGYAGNACFKWECAERFAYLWVDPAKRQSYVIWADDKDTHLWPEPMETWPKWAIKDAAKALGLN